MSVPIIDTLSRGRSGNSPFPTSKQEDLKIAYLTVNDLTERNAIPEWKRLPFMSVFVISEGKEYILGNDITIVGQTWTEKTFGVSTNVVTEDEIFDVNGFIQSQLIQNIFLNQSYVVANEAAMLALTSYTGNFFVRTDTSEVYIKLNNDNPADISDFALASSPGAVLSVNGQTGVVNVTIASLLTLSQNVTDLNTAITNSPTVLDHSSAISVLQSDLSSLQAYVDTNLGTKLLSATAQNPTITEDGYVIKWDNASGLYILAPDGGSGGGSFILTDGNGTTANGTAVDLGGILSLDTILTINNTSTLEDKKFTVLNNYSIGDGYDDVQSFIVSKIGINLISYTEYEDDITSVTHSQDSSFSISQSGLSFNITGDVTGEIGYVAGSTLFFGRSTIEQKLLLSDGSGREHFIKFNQAGITFSTFDDGNDTKLTIDNQGIIVNQYLTLNYVDLSSPPTPTNFGTISYDTFNNEFVVWNGSTWVAYADKNSLNGFLTGYIFGNNAIYFDIYNFDLSGTGNFTTITSGVGKFIQLSWNDGISIESDLSIDETGATLSYTNGGYAGFMARDNGSIEARMYAGNVYIVASAIDDTISIGTSSIGFAGIQYAADYSADYVDRSLVDKEFVETRLSSFLTGNVTGNITITDLSGSDNFEITAFTNISLQSSGDFNIDTTTFNLIAGDVNFTLASGTDFTITNGKLILDASTTTRALFNLPHGATPSSLLTDGDIWTTTSGLFVRINGTTVGPLGTGGGGGISDGDKGDITVSGSGATWIIDNSAVSLAKMADVATATVFYRKTAGTGIPEVQTLATLKTDLGLTGTNSGDQTSIVGITGTKAQFDTAVTDGNFLYVGDVTQYTDELAQDAIGAMIDTTLVYVDGTPLLTRAALTGAITASQGSNTTSLGSFTKAQLDAAVSDGNVMYVGDAPTAHTLDSHSNVTITANSSGEILKWNGSAWINNTLAEAGIQAAGSYYATIQDEGTPLTQRSVINFTGNGLVAQDNAGNTRTDISLNATLAALSAYSQDGFVVQTAANTFTARDIAGTTDKITVTNGDGVAGNPTITIGADVVDRTISNTYTVGARQIFTHDATNAGLRLAEAAGNPSSLGNGDFWLNSTTDDAYMYINGISTALTRSVIEDVSTTTYTFTEADRNKIKRFTHASGCTAEIPLSLTLNWSTSVYRASGAGTLSITVAGGGTVEGAGTTLDVEKTMAYIHHRGSSVYILAGAVGSSGGGYTNLTQFVAQTAWRTFYSNDLGDVTELAFGASGTYLQSNGASAAPTWVSLTSNATHTGDVTGATALTLDPTAISGKTAIISVDTANDYLLIWDATDSLLKKVLPSNLGLGGGSISDTVYGVGWNGDTTTAPSKNAVYDKIETLVPGTIIIELYNGGSDLTTGIKDTPVRVPFGFTVTGWEILAYDSSNALLSTSCVVDILSDTFANLPLAGTDSIAGTEKPTLSSASTASDNSITTWTAVTAGNYIQAEIESVSAGTKKIVVVIKGNKS